MAKPTLTELWDAPPPSAPAPTPPVAPVAAPEVVPEPVDMPPAPVAPARKVSLTEAWESSGDRAPTVRVDALKEDLARGGALLATATRAERKREGASDEEADAAAKAITDTALVLGDNADSGRVREALAARVGVDTLDKAMTRAFGQRIMEVPLAAPTKAERQQKLRDQELENRSVEKGLAAAWKGEGSTERPAEEGEIRPWVEAVDRLGWNSGEDVLTSVFSGGLVPAYKLITNAPEIVKGYATDKDVQNLTGLAGSAMSAGVAPLLTGGEDPFSRTIRAMAVSSGLPDVTAAGMDALGFDSYSVSEFADNVHAKPEFDAAAYDLVTKGDRAAFEAVPFNKLPEMAKGELVDAARVREAIRSGKPGFEPLAGMEDLRDDVLSTQASFLPVSVIRTIQPDAVPDDLRIKDVFAKREAAKPWRGDDMGASAAKLMNSALLRSAGDGKTLMVAPGRFQELLRFANAIPAAVTNVNIGTDTPVFNAPLALPRAALYAAEEAGIPGAENIRGKVEAFKVPFLIGPGGIPIPQPAAWESMIQSGEYDDLLEAVGMFTSDRYANRYDPESTWLSRTLTEIANPDAAGQYLGDTYERLGGDPESTTARVLRTADLAVNIGMPAEEMVLLPIAKATAATNRARRAANAARELGLNPTAARKAAKESVFVGSDPRQAVADSLTRAAVEGIRDGTLNPAKVPTATKKAIESVLRAAGMPEDLLTAEKGRPYAKIWDDLADRRARILETAADFETIGGPATQKLRASPEYRAVADQLDVFTRTRTMTPDEEAAVAADIAAGRVPKMTGNLSMRDRDLVLRFLEAAAFRAAEDGRVASPEEYFARHSWETGVEGEALPPNSYEQRTHTRVPTGKGIDVDPSGSDMLVGLDAAKAHPESFATNVALMESYPLVQKTRKKLTTDQRAERVIDAMKDNLVWLHNRVRPEIRNRSRLWYDGASQLADVWAERYGLPKRATAGVIAALSPQTDWFMNVTRAERILDAVHAAKAAPWDAAMEATAARIFNQPQYRDTLAAIRGKSLAEVDGAYRKAMWIRIYDETFNPRTFRELSPENEFIDYVRNADGSERDANWAGLRDMAKAIEIIETPDMPTISRALGGEHKVRNFYNNIFDPKSTHGDVTIDTHAVAAAHLRPFGGTAPEVVANFGGKGSSGTNVTGQSGTYALYAEAYRRAAQEVGLLPRELQSITWEAVRGLFDPSLKKGLATPTAELWQRYAAGKATLDDTRNAIVALGGDIRDPVWSRPGRGGTSPRGTSSYADKLPDVQLARSGLRDGAAGGGGTGVPAGGPSDRVAEPLYSRESGTVHGSIERVAPESPKPRTATMFSGGGLVEEGLRGIIDPVYAVEANEAIGAAYKVAHGDHVRIGDVRTTPTPGPGEVDYLHASPVCKDYTKAKIITADGEQPIDLETATATAKAIDQAQPPVFTLENVPAYANSEAMKIIEGTLNRNGYTFDARVYDAADYGAPTQRKRLLLRAVKDGPLPPVTPPTGRTGDWYATVKDLAPSLPSDAIPPWMAKRLDAAGVNWRTPDRPIIVMGGSAGKNVPFAYAGGPAPTIKATPAEAHRIILPGGEVRRVTPRAMARITGIPDSYPLPDNRALATTIIGNGVPPALSRSVFGPLLGADRVSDGLPAPKPKDKFHVGYRRETMPDLNEDAIEATFPTREAAEAAVAEGGPFEGFDVWREVPPWKPSKGTTRAVIQGVADSVRSTDPALAAVADHLVTIAGDVLEGIPLTADEFFHNGVYHPTTNTIRLNPDAAPITAVHEAVHAVTYAAIHDPMSFSPQVQESVRNLNGLYDAVRKIPDIEMMGKQYGLTNVDEFVAEAMSRPEFQDLLREIKVSVKDGKFIVGGDGTSSRSLWDEFVTIVSKILGFSDTDALSHVLSNTNVIAKEYGGRPLALKSAHADLARAVKPVAPWWASSNPRVVPPSAMPLIERYREAARAMGVDPNAPLAGIDAAPMYSRESGVTRGSISPGTPDTVNVPNPDYAAWEARVNALSAEVDTLKSATPEPAEIPNPAFPEAVKRVQATDAEIRDLKQQASRAFGVNPAWTEWEAEIPNLANDPVALGRHMAAQPPKSAQHVNNAMIAAKEAELATLRANIPPRTMIDAPPVDDVLNAKAEALARLRQFKIPKEVTKPSDVSRWLIKLFRTGDVKTAFHEGTHLLDLMMGEEWTRRAMEALGYDPTGPITTEVRERIAEAGTRALRGTLRPGSQLGNVFEDFRDTIGDVWRRVKREPAVTTPAFRKLWDKTFAPDDAEMMVAAHLVDQHGTGPLGRVVTTSGNVAEEIREGAQRAAGMAENAANVMRANQEIRQALGLTNDMTSIAVGDLLGRALAYTATTHALRGWGFGDLEGLTARTAVPAARAKRIQNEVAMYRKAVLGGKEAPTPVVVDGREVFMLNRDQQAGVRRMLADLANEPVSVDLPERLQDPRADLSQITREEWANIADRQLEVRAGAGAWRDRLAERAAVSAGIRFGQMAMDAARNQQSAVSAEANALRDAFVTTIAADEYLNPAAREVLKSVAREIGESGSRVKNAVIKAMNNGEKAWADAFKDVAASLPPEVVPVEELRTLRRVEPLATTDSFDEVAVGIPAISRLFTRAPVGSTAQMVQEQRSLSILDSIGLRLGGSEPPPPDVQFAPEVNPDAALGAFEQSATRFDDAIADAGYTRAEVDDAMATVQEGIKRRAAVFDNRASEIMHAFAGSDDVQVFAGMDPAKLTAAKYRAYESWYTGDWADNLLLNTELGQAARGPVYDQGMAVLNVLTRLEAAKVRASLARRLADVGVVADPASFLRGGVRLDRPYVFGTAANDVETITGEAYKQDVMHYLEAFTGWKMTSTNRLPTMETERVFAEATGMRAASGSVNKAAASDALRMIQSWGMKMGKGSAWETITLPDGGQIVMPTMFKEPIEKALADSAPLGGAFTSGPPKLGNIVPGTDEPIAAHYRAVNAALTMLGTAYQYSFGMLKTGLTTGMGPLIRPAFFMGNFIGGMGQLYQGVGAVKALEIMARPLLPTAEGRMTRAVIARMWNNGAGLTGTGAMMPAELGRFDAVGRWHSDQSLASGATRAGLNSSLVKTEFAQSIAEDIKAAEPTLWNRLMDSPKLKAAAGAVIGGAVAGPGGAVVGAGAFASLSRTWQDFFREAATGIDNYYRVSTYIGEVLRGVPEEQAAELARRVAFDYNNVTEFEKNYLRKGVLFYSFQRNNQNLFWWTLLNHPSRVMVQLRALRGAQQENYGEDAELFAPSWGEGRIPFRFRPAFEAGHADRAMQGAVTLTPRLSIADAVGLWQSLLGMTTELDPSAAGDLASKLNPWIQLSFVMSTGQDIHWQRSIEGFNTIPNWFVEMDENLTGGMVVNDLFGKVPAQYRNPSQEGYPGAPQWIVNPDGPHSRAWWVFRQMTMGGAMLDTITAMQRADFGDTLIEGGVVQKGVDLSRGAARADGREPLRNEPDTEMARSGLTEEEELGSWLGFKPVQVLDRDQALAPLIQRRESEQNAKMRTLKKEGERAYH